MSVFHSEFIPAIVLPRTLPTSLVNIASFAATPHYDTDVIYDTDSSYVTESGEWQPTTAAIKTVHVYAAFYSCTGQLSIRVIKH